MIFWHVFDYRLVYFGNALSVLLGLSPVTMVRGYALQMDLYESLWVAKVVSSQRLYFERH